MVVERSEHAASVSGMTPLWTLEQLPDPRMRIGRDELEQRQRHSSYGYGVRYP